MKKHLPTFLFLIFIIQIQTFAQDLSSKKIGGMVIDESGQPIAGAIISEIDTDNNIASNSNITQSDSLGVFVIEIPMNCMSLYVTSLGYKPKMTSLTDENDSPIEIMLAYSNTVTIDSVVVKGYRKAVTVKPDKIVYNMSATPIKEGNTLEAFRYIPLISADDNSFSIVGKNSTIVYINDRKTNMNSESLIAYLKSLPPDNIQTVDVIVNPGSTFRGEGNFGVINIKLKGYEFEGVKGNALVRVWKTHYWKESANLNLNVTRGKSMTNISTGIANYSSWKEGDVETNYLSSTLTTNKKSIYSSREPEFYANIQSDYQLNKNSVFGVAVNAYYSDVDVNESGLTTFDEKGADVVDKLIDMNVNADKKNLSLSANTNYRYNSDDGAQYAMVDFDYLHKNNRNNSFNVMNYLNSDMSVHSNYMNFTQAAPLLANVLSGKVEYGNKFEKVADVKLGIDTYYSNILNDNVYRNWDGGSYEQDDTKSNKFEIKESTSALFLQLDRNWMNKINVSLGARLEYTQYNGLQHATNEQFKTDDWHFLPSLNLNYMPSKSHSLTYNASYRISRPPFSYLNPFIQYTSPTSYSVGNPFLLPTKYFSQSLNYGLKSKFFFSVAYLFSDETLNPAQILRENGVIENTLINMGTVESLTGSFSTMIRYLAGKGSSNFNISYQWKKVKGASESGELDYAHNMVNINLQNNLTISEKQKIYLNYGGRYSSSIRNSYLELPPSANFNASLSKSLKQFNFALYTNLVYYIYDGKFTQSWKIMRNNNYINEAEYTRGENVSVGLSISYNFGNMKVKGAQNRNTSGGSVKDRVY